MAFFVSGAIIGGSVISGGLGYLASQNAANKQAEAASNALDFQKQTYAQNQQNFTPYMNIGKGATYTLGNLMGIGSNGQQTGTPDYSSFFQSPDYQFAQQQGNLAIQRAASAAGQTLSGGTLKDIASYNSGLASQQYGNYFNRLVGLAQLGSGAASGAAGNATANSANIGNTTQALGQAQASGIVGGANAITGGINSGISNTLLSNYLNQNKSAYGNVGSMPATGAGSPNDFTSNMYAMSQGINPFG